MTWNFGEEVQFGGGECHGARYITHFYCLAIEAGFYSDVVECLPVDLASWVRFPAGTGKIFSLYDIGAHRKSLTHPSSGSNSPSLIRNDSLWPGTSGRSSIWWGRMSRG